MFADVTDTTFRRRGANPLPSVTPRPPTLWIIVRRRKKQMVIWRQSG